MPRGVRVKDERPASQQVAWVKFLPKEGGDWGRGVTATVSATEAELSDLEKSYEAMCNANRAKESEMAATIRARQKLLLETSRRADVEVKMLYAEAQIDAAKGAADRHAAATSRIQGRPVEAE